MVVCLVLETVIFLNNNIPKMSYHLYNGLGFTKCLSVQINLYNFGRWASPIIFNLEMRKLARGW